MERSGIRESGFEQDKAVVSNRLIIWRLSTTWKSIIFEGLKVAADERFVLGAVATFQCVNQGLA